MDQTRPMAGNRTGAISRSFLTQTIPWLHLREWCWKESPGQGRAGALSAVHGLGTLLRDKGLMQGVGTGAAWAAAGAEEPITAACGQGWGTHRALWVQGRAHADEGEPELAVPAEGLAEREAQPVPPLPQRRLQEVGCGDGMGWGTGTSHVQDQEAGAGLAQSLLPVPSVPIPSALPYGSGRYLP